MDKEFEDYFSELQADMIAICLEYCNKKADSIYVYCSFEENIYSAGFFYKINNRLLRRHEVNLVNSECDVSINTQKQVMKILIDDLKEINEVCKKFEREMPSEIKLIYDVNKNSLSASYKYEPLISNNPNITAYDMEKAWFEELEEKN